MNETSIALENISDPGKFEALVTAILRNAHPNYATLIHTGINSIGKAITAPVDGITQGQGATKMHFIMAQHTTCLSSDLRTKWFGNANKKGDIHKAYEEILIERRRNPDASLTLILSTNRTLKVELVRDVTNISKKLNIEIDIWEQSKIVHFLDHDASGQWLREQYLDIKQQLLSSELLTQICEKNLTSLQSYIRAEPINWIDRDLDSILHHHIESSENCLTFLIMPSGTGKTIAASKLLYEYNKKQKFGLWLPNSILEISHTLDQAINNTLLLHNPGLNLNTGSTLNKYLEHGQPFLLVVDDINKSSNPALLAERLLAWGHEFNEYNKEKKFKLTIICPILIQTIERLPEKDQHLIYTQAIKHGPFSKSEATQAIQNRATNMNNPISELQAREIAKTLGNDPLLIALTDIAPQQSAASVVPNFIDQQIRACCQLAQGQFLASDFHLSLHNLAYKILVFRDFTPDWQTIKNWFSNDSTTLDCIRQLIHKRILCYTERVYKTENLIFRHDRVRDAILIEALCDLMKTNLLPDEVMSEPYYADIIGQSLVHDPPDSSWIKRLQLSNPLALFYAFKIFKNPHTEFEHTIVNAIFSWLKSSSKNEINNTSLRLAIKLVLARTDSPLVTKMANYFSDNDLILASARFLNKDIRAGAYICYKNDPQINSMNRDELIEHALKHAKQETIDQTKSLLLTTKLEPNLRIGLLNLAGFIAEPALEQTILEAWHIFGKQEQNLLAFFWAACQCAGEQPAKILDPILDYLETLPESKGWAQPLYAPYRERVYLLRRSFANKVPSTLRYLIAQGNKRPKLRWTIALLLQDIDHPDVACFIAGERAYFTPIMESTNSIEWTIFSNLNNGWRMPLGSESRQRLQAMWMTDKDKSIRKSAFELWSVDAIQKELPLIQDINPKEEYYDQVIQLRIKLADITVIPIYLQKLQNMNPEVRNFWWQLAPEPLIPLLLEQIKTELKFLASLPRHTWGRPPYITDGVIAKLLTKLDPNIADNLLEQHWKALRFSPIFVQAALLIATQKSCSLAVSSICSFPMPEKLFHKVIENWQFNNILHVHHLSLKSLNSLKPYFHFLTSSNLETFWKACNLLGFQEWRRQNLDPVLPKQKRRALGIDDIDLIESLNQIPSQKTEWFKSWFQAFKDRGDPPERALHIIQKWLIGHGTLEALSIAAEAITYIKKRSSLKILEIPEGPTGPEAEAVIANARFDLCRQALL